MYKQCLHDPRVEQRLDRGAYAWEFVERIPIRRIDMKRSSINPSRMARKIDEDRVLNYGITIESGVKMPAPILLGLPNIQKNTPDLLVITGMHRLGGFELAKVAEIDAYVVNEADEYRVDDLMYTINFIEGKAPNQTEQILDLIALHEKYPHITLTQLATDHNIKPEAVRLVERIQKAKARARAAGYDLERMKVTNESMKAMESIWDDGVFARACAFVNNYAPSTVRVQELCRDIRKAPHEQAEGIKVIKSYSDEEEFKQRARKAKTGRTPPGRAERFQSKSKSLLRDGDNGLEQLHIASLANPQDLKLVWEQLLTFGKRVIAECDRVAISRAKRAGVNSGDTTVAVSA